MPDARKVIPDTLKLLYLLLALALVLMLWKVSCSSYIGKVGVPLCISALDDPVCTRETIPWMNVGGLGPLMNSFVLFNSSSLIRREKIQNNAVDSPLKSIDQAPYVNIREDGVVAFINEASGELGNEQLVKDDKVEDNIEVNNGTVQQESNATTQFDPVRAPSINAMMVPVKNGLNQLSRRRKISMWILACVAITTTWPILGSLFFKKNLCNNFSSSSTKR